jgi:hypothetical protein
MWRTTHLIKVLIHKGVVTVVQVPQDVQEAVAVAAVVAMVLVVEEEEV